MSDDPRQPVLKRPSARLAGLRAKRQGQAFESIFQGACGRFRLACTRMPEGCKRVGLNRLIQVRTPWDWIISLNGRTALIDTKSCGGAAFPHSAIEPHQISEMLRHANQGAAAGYVIWLREIDQVLFVPVRELYARIGSRGSIALDSIGVIGLGPSSSFNPNLIFGRSLDIEPK